MRLIKLFGLAALVALASMAFVGVTTAAADEDTQLCNAQHMNGLQCNLPTELFTVAGVGDSWLLTDLLDILCLHVLGAFLVLELGEAPEAQVIHAENLTILGCGSNAAHSNCTVAVSQAPLFLLLKTDLNLGEVEGHGGAINLQCTILGIIRINCTYAAALGVSVPIQGALHDEGPLNGDIDLDQVPNNLVIGGVLCPDNSTLDSLLVPDSKLWIAS